MKKGPQILSITIIVFACTSLFFGIDLQAGTNGFDEGQLTSKVNQQQLKVERLTSSLLNGIVSKGGYSEGVSMYSPSNRKKDHWAVYSEEDEINTKERELRDYESANTITNIKKVDQKNNVVEVKKNWIAKISEQDYMEIFISGGGFSGGVDPVINDRIMISNSGLLQKYYETELGGVKKYDKKIDRAELTELIRWIAEEGFFSFESEYECETRQCQSRLNQYPKPVPLKIVVAVGPYRNVVSVPIFSPNMSQAELVQYPEELRKIVEAIYVFASL
ncbi:MAG: hypothetical protein R2728_03800 [Chitinophagales bacterium]